MKHEKRDSITNEILLIIMCCCDVDVDECAVNNGGCDEHAFCDNTPGSFICTCMGGYFGDGFNCTGKF